MQARPFLPLAALGLLALFTACGATEDASAPQTSSVSPSASSAASPTAVATPTQVSSSASASDSPAPSPSVDVVPSPQVQHVEPSPLISAHPEPAPTGTVVTVMPDAAADQVTAPAPGGASSAAGVAICDYHQLYIEAAASEGAAGSRYITLTFNNTGATECAMSGYPAVHYVDHQGHQIGAAAANATEWSSSGAVLLPGEQVKATLRETRAQLYGEACQSVSAAGYSIQAPGSSQPLVMNFVAEACSNPAVAQLSVGAVGAAP